MGQFLECCKLLLDFVTQFFALLQRTSHRAGALDMTPYQFIWIQVRGIAGQEVQGKATLGGYDIFLDECGLVRRQAIEHQMDRLPAVLHHLLEQLDEQFCVEATFVGAKPECPIGIHRRSRTDGLALSGTLRHRCLSPNTPSLAMHCVSAKARLVPEENLGTLCFGLGYLYAKETTGKAPIVIEKATGL